MSDTPDPYAARPYVPPTDRPDADGEATPAEAPADALATLSPAPEALLVRAIADLRMIMSGPTIQARCLSCPPTSAAPQLSDADRSWVARWLSLG